jgi:hypothetical protein
MEPLGNRIRIPWSAGTAMFASLLLALFGSGTGAAILTLVWWEGLEPTVLLSIAWIGIVVWLAKGAIGEHGGLQQALVQLLGVYMPTHFAETTVPEDGIRLLRIGFKIPGHEFLFLEIAVSQVESVEWWRGQAGETEYRVGLWYDHLGNPRRPECVKTSQRPDQELYTATPGSREHQAKVWAQALVGILVEAGARLEKKEGERCWVRLAEETE